MSNANQNNANRNLSQLQDDSREQINAADASTTFFPGGFHAIATAYSDYLRRIEGQILEMRINIGHDVSSLNGRCRRPAAEKRTRDAGQFCADIAGFETYRFVGVIVARNPPNGLKDCMARSRYNAPIFCDSAMCVSKIDFANSV